MIKRLFLAPLLFAAALAAGCMTLPGYEPGFRIEAPKGERLVVLVTATWRTAGIKSIGHPDFKTPANACAMNPSFAGRANLSG